MMSEFNKFLKSINKPILSKPVEVTIDQEERLSTIEKQLGIERTKTENISTDEGEQNV